MLDSAAETRWHDDGHVLWLELNKSDLVVVGVLCPHRQDGESACRHRTAGCLVEWFVMRYGLECNVGVCAPAGELPVAWSLAGDPYDLDACQCWIIPISDDVFSAWAAGQRGGPE